MHCHLVAERNAIQFEGTLGAYQPRIVGDRLAPKMDSDRVAEYFYRTGQYLTPAAALGVDQFQPVVFQDSDKAILPVGGEKFCLPIMTLLGPLLICQGFLIAACENERFTIIKWIYGGIFPAAFAHPGPFE